MKCKRLIVFAAMLISAGSVFSQTVASPYEVGTWQGFRSVAVSYTFDDGSPNQYAKAIPMFDEFGFPLTMFTISSASYSWAPNWPALQNAASRGHEIASHTVTHTNFSGMSDSLQNVELGQSKAEIESHITGQPCVTMAYPFCVAAKRSICEQYYIAARICSGSIIPNKPGDFMNLSSIICGELGSIKTALNFNSMVASAVKSKGWCVYLIHGIDGDGGWSSLSSDTLRKSLEFLNANQDKYWVSTFGNVARYIKERNALSVTESSTTDTSLTVQVTDTLNNSIFNYPVTIRRPLPAGWLSAAVTQNGASVESRIVDVNSVQTLQFDAVPDGGNVLILKQGDTGVETHGSRTVSSLSLSQNYPNPFNPSTTIEFTMPEKGDVRLVLVNQAGQIVKNLASGSFGTGTHRIKLDASSLASGVYYYQLHAGDIVETQKLVLTR